MHACAYLWTVIGAALKSKHIDSTPYLSLSVEQFSNLSAPKQTKSETLSVLLLLLPSPEESTVITLGGWLEDLTPAFNSRLNASALPHVHIDVAMDHPAEKSLEERTVLLGQFSVPLFSAVLPMNIKTQNITLNT